METQSGFSVLIPSWNNLPYLMLAVASLKNNSSRQHEILVFLNEGTDGSAEWLQKEGIRFLKSETNVGVCVSLNRIATLATRDWLLFLNDDMYVLPGWDRELIKAAEEAGTQNIMLSSTLIEPRDTKNPCVIVSDFGADPASFKESELLGRYTEFVHPDWSGSSWPPSLVHRNLWNAVGGYSEEFSPGMSSDPDFAMKLWSKGVRYFRGMGNSRVYHFQAKSTGRIVKNDGRRQFLFKWGINQSVFYRHYLKMGRAFSGPLKNPSGPGYVWGWIRSKLKKLLLEKPRSHS